MEFYTNNNTCPVFRLSLFSKDDPERKVAVELYSLGADGLFIRLDGKTKGKVNVIENDPKFVFKRYLADWNNQSQLFQFTLQHRIEGNDDENGLIALNWKMSANGEKFASDSPEVKIFPEVDAEKHTLILKAIFAEKPGGLGNHELGRLLYPLPVEPYDPKEKVEFLNDKVTGERYYSAKIRVVSCIPTEHILAYIRGSALAVEVNVAKDTVE